MNILPDERGQVYLFASREFGLEGKRVCHDVHFEIREARDALQSDPHGDPAGREDPAFAQAHLQGIRQRGDRRGARFLQIQPARILFTLQMKGVALWNLTDMNFHWWSGCGLGFSAGFLNKRGDLVFIKEPELVV